jgi:hypothetical protein
MAEDRFRDPPTSSAVEDCVWIRLTPPVSRSKYHLSQRASQVKQGTKGNRVHKTYKNPFVEYLQ